MNKKRILKIILLIVIIVVVCFLIPMVRNFIIIDSMQKKIAEYDSTNFYRKTVAKENEKIVTIEYYRKDDKQVVLMEMNENGKISKTAIYDTRDDKVDVFEEIDGNKTAKLNYAVMDLANIVNGLENDNKWTTFMQGKNAKVKTEKLNDKKCYAISNFVSLTSPNFEEYTAYIDKETGLLIKTISKDNVIEYEYDIGNVKDDIFIEPDISQYSIMEVE